MLFKTLIVAAALIAFLVAVIMARPSTFRIERSALLTAPASTVFDFINNLRKWNSWSPWAKLDPNAKNTFEGPESGVGAVFSWAGNNQVGEGRMTILESRPNEYIRFKLEFFKPFQAVNTTEFIFKPENGRTSVTWVMTGNNNVIAKIIGLFMDCGKMVGGQFERGLANLENVTKGA